MQVDDHTKTENADVSFAGVGLKILKSRYLQPNETVDEVFTRIAGYLANNDADKKCFKELLLKRGIMFSSTFASDRDDSINHVACKLYAPDLANNNKSLACMTDAYVVNTKGTGIGVNVSMIPEIPRKDDPNTIKSTIQQIMSYFDNASLLTTMARKPKTALYTHIHCDNIESMLEMKVNRNEKTPDNVFVAVMINEVFISLAKNRGSWNLFPGDLVPKLNTAANNSEYLKYYSQYSKDRSIPKRTIPAMYLLNKIASAICTVGNPYVINIDFANMYNNQSGIGPVLTYNLCAEITGVATSDSSSDCVLASVSVARAGPELINILKQTCNSADLSCFKYQELAEYSFLAGRLACRGLNVSIGNKPRREIGISPLGFSDYVLAHDELYSTFEDVIQMATEMSEALYLGAVVESCEYFRTTGIKDVNFEKTRFAEGLLQFDLREVTPTSKLWGQVREMMKLGMANTMLTCQAPTVTTSSILEVHESIQIPESAAITKLDINSRQMFLYDGFKRWCEKSNINMSEINSDADINKLFLSHKYVKEINEYYTEPWIAQLALYEATAPFIDHSQATTINFDLNPQNVCDLILMSRDAKLKTAVYYAQMKKPVGVMTMDNSESKFKCDACTM